MKKLTYTHTKYACYIGYITQAIVCNLAPLLFLIFQETYGINLEQIGLLVSVNYCVQIAVDLLGARYADRIGYRPLIVTAHLFAAAGLVGLSIFPGLFPSSYAGLLTAVVCYAVGGGLIEVLISPTVQSLPGEEKEAAMSLLHSFYCWGHVAVVLLSTLYFVTAGKDSWKLLPVLWAAVPLLNTVLFTRVPMRILVEEEERMPVRTLLSGKLFWIFVLIMICSGASELAMAQWSSLFAESGLRVSKTMGDLMGPCLFAAFMGLTRLLFGKYGGKADLQRFMAWSGVLCVISYLLAALSPVPVLSLIGCGLCGLSVGILWPGTFSMAARHCPGGGTALFGLLALAGDVGCAAGPGMVGAVSNAAGHWNSGFLAWLSRQGANGGLKAGLLTAVIFPAGLLILLVILRRAAGKTQKKKEESAFS